MPFANLPKYEKDAFFSLLDEYFASRPELLTRVGASAETPATERTETMSPAAAAAVATAAQRALANPAASRALASGFQRASSSLSGNTASGATSPSPNADHALTAANVGRVAAAAQAFSATAPPARGTTPLAPPGPGPAAQRANSGGLVPQKKFGDVDVSSAGAMFRSLRGSTAAKNAPPPPMQTPSAFAAKKVGNGFAPPPVRRVPAHVPEPEPEPEPEQDFQAEGGEEATGQWAEALYDYMSKEAGDLHLRTGERVFVTDQTSSDWWTGEIGSRSGLFPASYVKLL